MGQCRYRVGFIRREVSFRTVPSAIRAPILTLESAKLIHSFCGLGVARLSAWLDARQARASLARTEPWCTPVSKKGETVGSELSE